MLLTHDANQEVRRRIQFLRVVLYPWTKRTTDFREEDSPAALENGSRPQETTGTNAEGSLWRRQEPTPHRAPSPRAASTRHPRSRLDPQSRGLGGGRSSRNLKACASAPMPQDLTSSAPAVAGPPYPRASPYSPLLPPPPPPSRLGTASSPPPRRTWPPCSPLLFPSLTAVPLNRARAPRTRPRAPPPPAPRHHSTATPPAPPPRMRPESLRRCKSRTFFFRSPSPVGPPKNRVTAG